MILKKLKVDLEDIAMCMDHQDRYDQNYYLDTETAETVCIPGELMRALEEGKSLADLPAWEFELVDLAKEVLAGSSRYVEIPVRGSGEAYDLMVEFAGSVKDRTLKEKLESALHGKGTFRRFKDTLLDHPEVEKEWFQFKADRDREEVREWLESLGIEIEKK